MLQTYLQPTLWPASGTAWVAVLWGREGQSCQLLGLLALRALMVSGHEATFGHGTEENYLQFQLAK